jgi:Cdc6-like AAA superfamily ATPase
LSSVRDILVNAFTPEREVEDPALFAGRRSQVVELAHNLHTRGTCPIIYGARGLGKSSLALQAQRIAMGDVTLLHDYGAHEWAIEADDAFRVFYVKCFSTTKDSSAILQLVINSFGGTPSHDRAKSASQPVDRTWRKRLSFKFFETETST